MNSENTVQESKSRRVFQCARRSVLKTPGKFILAATILAAMLGFMLLPGSSVSGAAQGQQDNDSESTIQRGFAMAPVPLDLRGKNRALVGKGSYIVNAQADCNACHSTSANQYAPGGNPFLGEPEEIDAERYLIGGRAFGPIRSRNLRPDPVTGLPAGYTFEQFLHVIRTGEDLKHLAPQLPSPDLDLMQAPMPWPAFHKMTDRDILAIYEYLRAIPSHTPGTGFP